MFFRMVKKSGQIFFRFVTMHAFDRQTDRRTDGQTDRNLIAIDRVYIPCSAVKIGLFNKKQKQWCTVLIVNARKMSL